MKREEEVTSEFLKKRFEKIPVFEPLGKSTPPDFSIDGTAFEVRRLNQRYIKDGELNEGLEQVDIPLNLALHRELSKIPFSDTGSTIFWILKFKRPLDGKIGSIVNQLSKGVREYYEEGSRKLKEIAVGGVTLDLRASNTPTGKGPQDGLYE
jgi:intein/homing endonuclease